MMSAKMKKMLMDRLKKSKNKKTGTRTTVKKDGNERVTMAMGGGMMYSKGGKAKGKMKNKKLAAMYGDPNKITRGDIITAAKKKGMKKPKKGKK
tara:strand:+ start:262 stop:543 length:282 start_codon:yes stop_codon:yes gene_type:complete